MKKNILGVLFAASLSIGVGPCSSPKPVDISIFHTNDLHLHLGPVKTDGFGLGGIARLSTLLKTLRGQRSLSLTLDGGDWSEGSWYFSVDAGQNMLRFMDRLGFDATVLGNHDFLVGPDQLADIIENAKVSVPVLGANLDMSGYAHSEKLGRAVIPSIVKQVGDLKIGVIGLTTFSFLYDSYMAPVRIRNPIDVASTLAAQLRPQVDLLIVISHNSFSENLQYARAIPGIDLVVSGHTHDKTPHPVIVRNTGRDVAVVETGSSGQFLGELKLSIDKGKKLVSIKGYDLHPVTSDIAEDPAIVDMVAEQDRILSERYGDVHQVMAQAEFDLIRYDAAESPLGNLAVKAYRNATGADLAIEEISLTGEAIPKGPVTLMDLHDVVPHIFNPATGKEWTVHVWNAKGSDLLLVFNAFFTLSGLMPLGSPLGWLSADNAYVTWDPTRAQSVPAVKSLKIGDQDFQMGARYRVALTDGLIRAITLVNERLGLGVDLSQMTDTGIEAWKSIADFAAKKGTLSRNEFKVGKQARTVSADVAIQAYSMSANGQSISFDVENYGLSDAVAGSVTCYAGVRNGYQVFNTKEQVWTPIGNASIPALASGTSAKIEIAWAQNALLPGHWPVKCEVETSNDSFPINNSAVKVFKVSEN